MTVVREANLSSARRESTRSYRAPLAVGIFGLLVSVAFSWVPSLWFDEAATISATRRSWPDLARMLGNVDAVHGLYYGMMRVWLDLVGYTPLTLRLPSAIGVGVAASLVVLLVRRFSSPRAALVSGVVFAILPRITWAGTEGRSYAITAMLAVALTLVFVSAWRSRRSALRARIGWWTVYGLLAALAATTFLYLVFLVAAHGVTVVWSRITAGRAANRSAIGWLAAAAAAGLVVAPLASVASGQSAQVDWIAPIDGSTVRGILVTQWFLGSPLLAAVGWGLIVVAVLRLWWNRAGHRAGAIPQRAGSVPSAASVFVPWLIVPTLGLVIVSVTVSPLYSPRYLSFSTPAVAILIGLTIAGLHRRRLVIGALAVLVALAAPQYVFQRTPEAKQRSSWSEVARFISDQRAATDARDAAASDAVIYGPVRQHRAATTRVIAYAYPAAFAGLIDVKLKTPAARTGELWETRYPLDRVTGRLDGVKVVWLVTSDKQDWRPSVTRTLAELGYSVAGEWGFTGVNVLRYER